MVPINLKLFEFASLMPEDYFKHSHPLQLCLLRPGKALFAGRNIVIYDNRVFLVREISFRKFPVLLDEKLSTLNEIKSIGTTASSSSAKCRSGNSPWCWTKHNCPPQPYPGKLSILGKTLPSTTTVSFLRYYLITILVLVENQKPGTKILLQIYLDQSISKILVDIWYVNSGGSLAQILHLNWKE